MNRLETEKIAVCGYGMVLRCKFAVELVPFVDMAFKLRVDSISQSLFSSKFFHSIDLRMADVSVVLIDFILSICIL